MSLDYASSKSRESGSMSRESIIGFSSTIPYYIKQTDVTNIFFPEKTYF